MHNGRGILFLQFFSWGSAGCSRQIEYRTRRPNGRCLSAGHRANSTPRPLSMSSQSWPARRGLRCSAALCRSGRRPTRRPPLGSGRLEELAAVCEGDDIDLVLFDGELTATQQRNLSDALPCRVVDRTALILDIFAARARSAEGRLQVELAQLQYLLPRLTGQGTALSRLGGRHRHPRPRRNQA